MADRKNIKVKPEVHERLSKSKPDGSTWDGYLGHLLDAYHDPRPRIPNYHSSGTTWAEMEVLSHEERRELAEQAKELKEQVDFKKLLQDSENPSEASAKLIAELTAERVVEKLEERRND